MTKPIEIDALVSSRICHDLISPVGAIANGIELLEELAEAMPEIALISESVESAKAKLQYFRICFGKSSDGATTSAAEMKSIGDAMLISPRIKLNWETTSSNFPREKVKLLFLILLCVETALPIGGYITVSERGGGFTIHAEAKRIQRVDAWSILDGTGMSGELSAAHVQFPIAAKLDRPVWSSFSETDLTVTI